ncbi:MAG TPA: hypothetical protein VH249_23225 [Xanthobacteraceae bacterium]|jgi:hypothetical protein|nr:hypothetical protein [Xanthobacteraceae bacterium]
MGRLPNLLRLGSKLVLEILPSIAATVIGGYLLTQLHFSRTSETPPPAAVAVAAPETPTVGEERAAIRDVLKARRENPQAPEVVRPKPATTASVPAGPPAPAATEPTASSEPAERASSRPSVAVATAPPARRDPDVPRPRPEAAASVYVPAPPHGMPVATAVPVAPAVPVVPAAPSVAAPAAASEPPAQALSPVVVSAPPAAAQMAPPPVVNRGPVGTVLSGISVFVGHAANATGNTVNWVIDLPGKAIEAGGRVIGVNPPPPPSGPS